MSQLHALVCSVDGGMSKATSRKRAALGWYTSDGRLCCVPHTTVQTALCLRQAPKRHLHGHALHHGNAMCRKRWRPAAFTVRLQCVAEIAGKSAGGPAHEGWTCAHLPAQRGGAFPAAL